MKLGSLVTIPFLSLISYCSSTQGLYGVGDIYTAKFSYNYDKLGYQILYKDKVENIISLQIKKTVTNARLFGIVQNLDLYSSVYVNGIKQDRIEASTTSLFAGYGSVYLYEVDFNLDEEDENQEVAYVDIECKTDNFDKIKYDRYTTIDDYDGLQVYIE